MLDIDAVTADYRTRGAAHAEAAASAAGTLRIAGAARLICFLVGVALAAGIALGRLTAGLGSLLLVVTVAIFVALVAWHRRVHSLEQTHRALEQACQWGIDRVHRRWDALPATRQIDFPVNHPFAGDVHLTGSHSLTNLFPALSAAGSVALRAWLLAEAPPSADALRARQEIVGSLTSLNDWRERLSMHAGRLNGTVESLDAFFSWAEGSAWLQPRVVLRWVVRTLTGLTILSFVAAVAQLIPVAVVMAFVVVNVLVTGAVRRELAETLGAASSRGARLRGYGALFNHAHTALAGQAELRALDERIGGASSSAAFASFDQLAACGEIRLSTMGHVALQALVLWDFHVVDALEAWQRRHGRRVRDWVTALAEVEALSALATLAHENPTWTFPGFRADAEGVIDATELAHPLLGADVRVANDLTVGPRGTILLVTGSNMAGKTTLLRAIALNVILAQAGAPVCARSLTLSRFRLRTSMRATDSLEEGLSLFMAELVRLKSIVDEARVDADCALLYLADEILRGTNAADRHAAIITVLETLAATGAVGVVATHDPDIAAAPSLAPRIHAVNLIEQFRSDSTGHPAMWFDYKLRPGVATTRNALKLLEMVGLDARP
jgi:predicted ATPase